MERPDGDEHAIETLIRDTYAAMSGCAKNRAVPVHDDPGEELVPYWTTGVFGRDHDGWSWRYWGGAEPQETPRV